jgi:hypothetical protein
MEHSNQRFWVAAALSLAFAGAARALPVSGEAAFSQGRSRLSLTGGYASVDEKSYLVLGAGAGYYLKDGLEAGLDGQAWLGSKPNIYAVSPEMRYIFLRDQTTRPYFGGFYKRTFYSGLDPLSSAGGRAGIVTSMSDNAFLSAGIVYEHYFDCSTGIYGRCNQTYPELGLSFSY